MNSTELEERLKMQLARVRIAKSEGKEILPFQVWDSTILSDLGIDPIRIEKNSWSWGHCTSDTCNHVSHDPYMEGDTVYIACSPCGEDETGHPMYMTVSGIIFCYEYDDNNHFAPTAKLREPMIAD